MSLKAFDDAIAKARAVLISAIERCDTRVADAADKVAKDLELYRSRLAHYHESATMLISPRPFLVGQSNLTGESRSTSDAYWSAFVDEVSKWALPPESPAEERRFNAKILRDAEANFADLEDELGE